MSWVAPIRWNLVQVSSFTDKEEMEATGNSEEKVTHEMDLWTIPNRLKPYSWRWHACRTPKHMDTQCNAMVKRLLKATHASWSYVAAMDSFVSAMHQPFLGRMHPSKILNQVEPTTNKGCLIIHKEIWRLCTKRGGYLCIEMRRRRIPLVRVVSSCMQSGLDLMPQRQYNTYT